MGTENESLCCGTCGGIWMICGGGVVVSELFNMANDYAIDLFEMHSQFSISSQRVSYDFLSLSWPRWKTLQILSKKPYNINITQVLLLSNRSQYSQFHTTLATQATDSVLVFLSIHFFSSFFLVQHVQILLNGVVVG